MAITNGNSTQEWVSGTLTAGAGQSVTIDCSGCGTVWLDLSGTYVGGGQFNGSIDGVTFFQISGISLTTLNGNVLLTYANGDGNGPDYQFDVTGLKKFQLIANVTSGNLVYQINASPQNAVISAIMSVVFVGQAGTWNINNISGTISLPTGASTSSLQTTGNTSLASIDTKLTTTNSDLTTINTSINALEVAQGSTTAGELGPLIQGAVTTTAPVYVTAKTNPLSLDTAGNLRVTATNFPITLDMNYGTVGASTLRTASEIGNATGAANFGAGATGAQTLRVGANLLNEGAVLNYGYGTVSNSQTLRVASQIGNATGAADFNTGATSAQTLRVTANLSDGAGTALTTTSGNLNVNINQATATVTIAGNKTNNNAAPGATNIGVLPTLANAAAPSWTEGDQVLLSTDLAGNARVIDIADGPVAPGTAATKSTLAGGQFNSTAPTLTNTQQAALQLDSTGKLLTNNVPVPGTFQTYSASGLVTSAASATDIFSITGSATKTVMITNLAISGIATSATVATIIILKRSAADTVGTPTTLTNIPNDSADAAGTAVCTTYAGVPTPGALVGNMKTFKVFLPPPTGGSANSPSFPISFPGTFSQPITLRGAAQTLAINLGGVTIAGAIFAVSVEWIEF